jgi:hypothetical protein
MKSFFCFILSTCLLSCANKLIPGKYAYADIGTITIDDNYNYKFQRLGETADMFSKGKILVKNNEVSFIPDSSYFLKATITNYYFDPALKGKKKVAIDNSTNSLAKFKFYFRDDGSKEILFDSTYSCIYDEKEFSLNQIVLHAKIKDSIVYWPKPYRDEIVSNSILFDDVNKDDPADKPWNVLKLKVNIDVSMFSFISLDNYILKKKKLIKKNWPVYELVK